MLLARVSWLASWKYIPRIVEVNDLFEAFEIAVVSVCFHELSIGPLIGISKRWNLDTAVVCSCVFDPVGIRYRGSAQEVLVLKKAPTPKSTYDIPSLLAT